MEIIELTTRGVDTPVRFAVRPGYSDEKCIRQVFVDRQYARYGSTPKPGELWYDLGANVGGFALWAAANGAQVVAFEPDPGCVAVLQATLRLNPHLEGRVRVISAGVWERLEHGTTTLHLNTARGNVWRNSIVKQWRGGTDIEVDMCPVGLLWHPESNIKMDIEGAEAAILERYGATPVNRLIVELSYDCITDMPRWRKILDTLDDTYDNVRGYDKRNRDPNHPPFHHLTKWKADLVHCWNNQGEE